MKLLFLILLPFFSLAQQSTYEKGDSTWLTSSDTSKVKVYKSGGLIINTCLSETAIQSYIYTLKSKGKTIHCTNKEDSLYGKPKYDTSGPVWKQVSNTGPGYNPVMAMQMYEVRVYKAYTNGMGSIYQLPEHFAWIDMGKKRFKFKVWENMY